MLFFIVLGPGLMVVVPSNVVDKWQTLDRVLSMLHDLGALCLQLGEARETILYLRQGMDVARAFGLPHRSVLSNAIASSSSSAFSLFGVGTSSFHSSCVFV